MDGGTKGEAKEKWTRTQRTTNSMVSEASINRSELDSRAEKKPSCDDDGDGVFARESIGDWGDESVWAGDVRCGAGVFAVMGVEDIFLHDIGSF